MSSQLNPSPLDPSILRRLAYEYRSIKSTKDFCDLRLKTLKNKIEPLLRSFGEEEEKGLSWKDEDISVRLSVVDRTALNEVRAAEILEEKGLTWCFKLVPDPSLVEQAYLQGALTDSDLREMRDPKYVQKLKVESIGEYV